MPVNKFRIQKRWLWSLLLPSFNAVYATNTITNESSANELPAFNGSAYSSSSTKNKLNSNVVHEKSSSLWHSLWGVSANDPTLALGMWSYHLKKEQDDMDNSRNDLVGFGYRGMFVGTLINSQRRRSYVVGLQRYWHTEKFQHDLTWQVGYRLGLIYGYDRRFGRIAEQIPVLPFPQVISDLTWKQHFGWEISYTWVVVSTSFYYRF
jgi:hypothetical protein